MQYNNNNYVWKTKLKKINIKNKKPSSNIKI